MSEEKEYFADSIATDGKFPPQSGRYHLYVSRFCPFVHRTLLVRHLKNLHDHIEISFVHPLRISGRGGWRFVPEEGYKDNLYNSKAIAELYEQAHPGFTGKHSVPVLWDTQSKTIVSNMSGDIAQFFNDRFNDLPGVNTSINLRPQSIVDEIDEINKWVNDDLNAGVYKCGFAKSQPEYQKHVLTVFRALNRLESLLEKSGGPYILGHDMTEVDVRIYPTIVRFDTAYVNLFKANLGTIRHNFPLLNKHMKHLYWKVEAFRETTWFDEMKMSYMKSMKEYNPFQITPLGPYPDIEPFEWNETVPSGGSGVDLSAYEKLVEDNKVLYEGRNVWDD